MTTRIVRPLNSRAVRTHCPAMLAVAGLLTISALGAHDGEDREGAYNGGFIISGDRVTPDSRYVARFRVLGAEITESDGTMMPVTVQLDVAGAIAEPYGAFSSATDGNLNGAGVVDYIMPDQVNGGSRISIAAKTWIKNGATYDEFRTVTTSSPSAQVLTLRDGDICPSIPGFLGQNSISQLVRDYIDPVTLEVHLHEDEIIYLVELGTTNLTSPAADFQDLVILVTLAEDEKYFEEPPIPRTLNVTFD